MGTLHRRRTGVVLVTSLLLGLLTSVAVAAVPVSAQEPSPSPSPAPAPEPLRVTETDTGRTVHLVPGQELVVELTAPSQGEHWQGPATAGPLYLVQYSESLSRTTARLQALHSTKEPVGLRARTDRQCFHDGSPCPQGFSEWRLSVVVDDGPAHTPSYQCTAMPQITPAPGTTHLENGANGSRVTVAQGSTVQVWLRGCEDPYTIAAAGSGPLHRISASSRANGVSMTTFRATGTGTATITAQTDPSCFHTATPCARPSRLWSVEVEVVPEAADDSCLVPTEVELDRSAIVATGAAAVTVRTAPGSLIDLYAYTRPSTTYRVVRSATSDGDGLVRFTVRPPANTRLYAQKRGCQPGPSTVLNVATALSLEVVRTGPREYVFSGDSLPARPGGLIVSLYRLTDDGRQVLTAQARADADNGEWSLVRRFTGTGRFGFVVRTGQDLQNAPGASNVRSLLVF